MNLKKQSRRLILACDSALETLEHRQLLAAASALPLRLDFDTSVSSTILDKQGRGTGFTGVQANSKADQYQSGLINLDTANGVLKLTSRGSATSGSASGLDNSLTDGLETTFNGNQSGFVIETRLIGPLSNLNDRFEQAGIYFGPDQDHFVKLVAGRNFNGQYLSFEDEFTNATGGVSSTRNGTNAQTSIGSFASINTLDLRIVGDAATGKISAYYRSNSSTGAFTKVAFDVTIAPEQRSTFFNATSKAGILAQNKNDVSAITATFDSFSISPGARILAHPSVASVDGMDGTTLDVRRDAAIKAILSLANGSSALDASTLSDATVKLYRAGDQAVVAASLTSVNNGSAIVIAPSALLDPNTSYTVEITGGLKDQSGATFQPFVTSFTTGTSSGGSDVSQAGPAASFSVDKVYFSDISATATSGGSGTSLVQTIRVTNTGVANLMLSSLSFGGANGSEFHLGGSVTLPASIEPGGYLDIPVVFQAAAIGIRTATLTVSTNDPTLPAKAITLRGLGTAGAGGSLEPSLQRILDLYQIPDDVGDPTPDTTDYPSPPTSGEAIDIQKLIKAGSGPVTIEVLANFANTQTPSSRFGYYSPGNIADRTQMFTVGASSSQTARPVTSGSLSFDPTGEFGLYGEFPAFAGRVVASERALNTWETVANRQQKIRFYPLKNADGTVVPNAYVFAFEEYNVSYDQNDLVGIIRNVSAVAAGPELGFINQDGVPASDHLVMSRIRDTQVADPANNYIPNTVHDQSTLRVTNTGTQPLVISGTTLSNSDFTILSGGGAFTLAPGATHDVVVQFVYNRTGLGNEIRTATLTIASNDADESSKVIKLSGLWQSYSENAPNGVSQEPSVATVLATFGYNINVGTLNTHGAVSRAGEEILSEMWQSVDTSRTVTARQLAAIHQQKSTTNSRIRYLLNGGTGYGTTIFAHQPSDGQTLLPHINGSNTAPAYGEFQPGTSTFSWTVDSDQSIDSRNTNAYSPGAFPAIDGGHSLRFYAAKDSNGVVIPNTYILIMDYVGQSYSNFDYQDNIYILTNVKPVSGPLAPANPGAAPGGAGNVLTWTKNPEGTLAGYNIYRSTSSGGTYAKLNGGLVTGTTYTDGGAIVGTTYYYQIRPVDNNGTEGTAAAVSTTRSSDTVAPATPSYPTAYGQTSGVQLNWLDNTEGDLAGYNVYRASVIDGTYTKLNSSPLTSSDYFDLSAPGAATSFYRVTAIDVAGNESQAGTMNAYRPATGNVPSAPTALTSTTSTTNSITLSWTDNASDETGFIIERQNLDGTFSQIGTTNANVTTYIATGLQGGTSYVFRVRATNNAGPSSFSNEYTAATQQSAPLAATNLAAITLNANAVKLTWTDNAANETGYRIERRLGTSGGWGTVDTVGTNVTLYVDNSAAAATSYNYRVFATNAVGDSPASNIAAITTPSADGYASLDIGAPLTAGSTTVISPGKDYDITAGGSDIWGTSDQFRYVYKSITGDFDYSARITGVSIGDTGSMAGLMARESLAANSRHLYSRARAQSDLRGNYRLTTGGTSVGVSGPSVTFPNAYVRLQRAGNVFTAYGSTDGVTWTVMTQQTMANMPSTIFFGIAVSARSTTTTTTANVRDLTDRLSAVAPSAATNLVGSADTSGPSVSLAWTDTATNETGYRVERRVAGGATWAAVANLTAGSTSYLDTDVAINTQYVYRVFATNAAGDSAPTAELTVTVANGVPASPTNLVASNVAGGIQLAWTDNSSNELNFQVERRLANGTWASLAIVNANVTTYTDVSLTAGASYVYRVHALGSVADSGYTNEATINAPAALSFTSVDIGGATGGATQVINEGTDYNVTASGTDVWNSSDQFRFAYRQVTGNFDIRVRVAGINFTSDQSMAGLMARATLDANSRNIYVKARADGTDRMTYRSSTGGTTTGVGSGTSTFPNGYLRLTRVGNVFTGYSSVDGVTWTVVSSVTMSLPTTLYVGMAAASHVTGATTTAQFKDLTLA